MLKSMFLSGVLCLAAFCAQAQTPAAPFLKISHLGTEGRSIVDLYLATQEPALDATKGIDGRYNFQSVCLLTAAEFAPLLRYAETYSTSHQPDNKDTKYGTFEITLGTNPPRQLVYTRRKSVSFLQGAAQVLQKQSTGPDKSEALRRLEATAHRVAAPAK